MPLMLCAIADGMPDDRGGRVVLKDRTGKLEAALDPAIQKGFGRQLVAGDAIVLRNFRAFRFRNLTYMDVKWDQVGKIYGKDGESFDFSKTPPPGCSKLTRKAFRRGCPNFAPIIPTQDTVDLDDDPWSPAHHSTPLTSGVPSANQRLEPGKGIEDEVDWEDDIWQALEWEETPPLAVGNAGSDETFDGMEEEIFDDF